MSSIISFSSASGPDTKVRVNSIDPPKELQFLGAGVSIVSNDANGTYDITISGAAAGLATTSAAGIVQLATPSSDVTAGHVIQASDTRLSNSRTPTTHASTHKSGGSDVIRLDELSAPINNSNLNVSITAHGLCPILPNDVTKYLDGSGTFSVPPGSGSSGGETNTASNAGTAGVGIVLAKSGVNLPFKAINVASTKLTVADNPTNKTVDLDVTEGNLTLSNMAGTLDKTKIPATTVYTDQSNTYSAFDQIIPSSNLKLSNSGFMSIFTVGTLGGNTTLTFPNSTDTIVGRGSTDTLLNKTISGSSNTISNIADASLSNNVTLLASTQTHTSAKTFNDTTLLLRNPANTFSVTLGAGAQSAARVFTFPVTASDTIVMLAASQTLTNKTLTTPTIGSIINTGTLTLPTSTDTLVGRATTDTLTNKTLTTPVISTITNTGTITLPTATDTLTGRATTDTLTNKTINTTNNTLTSTSAAAGDLLEWNGTKFDRFPRGTANQVLATNAGGTDIGWATFNAENTGKATGSGNGSTLIFNIAHSIGSIPSVAFVELASHANAFTYTVDITNIVVTLTGTAPATGTNNVVFYWRAIA